MVTQGQRDFFAGHGYLNLGTVLTSHEISYFESMFDEDRSKYPYFWHSYGHHQQANYDALITSPKFDELIRHPNIFPVIEQLLGGPTCFGEIGLRYMAPYDGALHQSWHRDRLHWHEHALRMDYLQLVEDLAKPWSVDNKIADVRATRPSWQQCFLGCLRQVV